MRAAAEAAARDGWEISAVDLFGDVDTRRAARTWYPLGSPDELAQTVARLPAGGVVVTGGVEEWYETLDAIRPDREVWVPGTETLRTLREPGFLQDVAHRCGFEFPGWMEVGERGTPAGWLVKSRRLSGGRGVTRATLEPPAPHHYLQSPAPGRPFGAAFLATDSDTRLIGLSRSMTHAAGPHPYLHAGSVGPVPIDAQGQEKLIQLGETIRRRGGLRGLFGVDMLSAPKDDRVYLLEINPRYTAGMELFEDSRFVSLVTAHVEVSQAGVISLPLAPMPCTPDCCRVKRVVWTRQSLRWDPWWQRQVAEASPDVTFHDIPQPDAPVGAGEPLVTLWTQGERMVECLRRLRRAERHLLRLVAARSLWVH